MERIGIAGRREVEMEVPPVEDSGNLSEPAEVRGELPFYQTGLQPRRRPIHELYRLEEHGGFIIGGLLFRQCGVG